MIGPAFSYAGEGEEMSRTMNMIDAINSEGRVFISVVGMPEPIAHPVNCKHECPYGHDRAFCFPCYAKIMAEHRARQKKTTLEVSLK